MRASQSERKSTREREKERRAVHMLAALRARARVCVCAIRFIAVLVGAPGSPLRTVSLIPTSSNLPVSFSPVPHGGRATRDEREIENWYMRPAKRVYARTDMRPSTARR